MSLKKEEELKLIENNIRFNEDTGRWIAHYPWIKDPYLLPENQFMASATLRATERRLAQNPKHSELYSRQMEDMLNRGAAREISEEELSRYKGPKYYISHHAVLKPESKSTPCRIVFNSSAKYKGYALNDFFAKGPSLLNQLVGILLRFRQNRIGFIGDISKMFHSIDIPLVDQMTHLFLWRGMNTGIKPKTYAMTRVNMGDRPSSAIAQVALRNTAIGALDEFPLESTLIQRNSYMDDIPASLDTNKQAQSVMRNIGNLLEKKGFKIKEWIWSGSKTNDINNAATVDQRTVQLMTNATEIVGNERVLGIQWNVKTDSLTYSFGANKLKHNIKNITKRQILSSTSSIYDPLGLATPISVKAKIILRKIWAVSPKLGWDDLVPESISNEWNNFVEDLVAVESITFKRSLTLEIKYKQPTLVILSDGSNQAYGAAAYCRWKIENGKYESHLIAAKARIAPSK